MSRIHVKEFNETYIKLSCRKDILKEISEHFTFTVPNARHMPAFKSGLWDGKIRLVDYREKTLYKGLVPELISWARTQNYSISVSKELVNKFKEEIPFSWDNFHLPDEIKEVHNFQDEAVQSCLKKKRQIILSATGSGKSLIIYALARTLAKREKVLIVVSTLTLLKQMYSDFQEYCVNEPVWNAEDNVHLIFQGQDHNTDKEIVISTWQSLQNKSKNYMGQYGALIADEAHEYPSTVTKSIIERATNAFYRFGFTGTLNDAKTHEMVLSGLFGPPARVSETKELIERGILSKLKIHGIILKHSKKDADSIRTKDENNRYRILYRTESNYLSSNPRRNKFIARLAAHSKRNTLVLFNEVERQGKPLYELLKKYAGDNKIVFFIHGGTPDDERERIRKLCASKSNVVILATYKLFSKGVNIKRLENIVFAFPMKSKITVLQSIGRGLRTADDKEYATIFDLTDDLTGGRKTYNHTLNHFMERYNMYMKEGFDVNLSEYKL